MGIHLPVLPSPRKNLDTTDLPPNQALRDHWVPTPCSSSSDKPRLLPPSETARMNATKCWFCCVHRAGFFSFQGIRRIETWEGRDVMLHFGCEGSLVAWLTPVKLPPRRLGWNIARHCAVFAFFMLRSAMPLINLLGLEGHWVYKGALW